MLPRHALSNFMVWNAGVGPWWAATAEILKRLAMDSDFTACPHQPSMLNCSLLVKLRMFSVSPLELAVPEYATDKL